MSTSRLFVSIPIYQGAQGKFYMYDGYKYHTRFPIDWAMNHIKFHDGIYEISTGPKECKICNSYGSIRGVFVGYCNGCLEYYSHLDEDYRGNNYASSLPVYMLEEKDMWFQYPYMHGVKKSEIGDEEDLVLTSQEINSERNNETKLSQEKTLSEISDSDNEDYEIDYEFEEDNNNGTYDISLIAQDNSSINSGVDSLGNLSW